MYRSMVVWAYTSKASLASLNLKPLMSYTNKPTLRQYSTVTVGVDYNVSNAVNVVSVITPCGELMAESALDFS